MAMEYKKDLLKMDQLVGEQLSQALIEGEIVVTEGKPDIARILDISGTVYTTGQEVIQDQVMVEGIIRYNLLYIATDENQSITNQETEIGFTEYVEVTGARPRMMAKVALDLEHIDYDVESPRKLNVKTVLNAECRVEYVLQMEVVQDFEGDMGVQALKEGIEVIVSGGEGSGQSIIREDIQLPDDMPSVVEILKKEAQVKILEKRVADNRIIVHGQINIKLLYLSNEKGEPIQFLNHEFPFSQFIEISGAYQGMECEAGVDVQELDVGLRQDIIGDIRILTIEMMLLLKGRTFEMRDHEIIMDAYSPGRILDLTKRNITLTRNIGEKQAQATVRENISLPDSVPEAARILYAEAKPILTDYSINQGQVVVEGILATALFYQPKDEQLPIASFKSDIPFTQNIDFQEIYEDMECDCQLSVSYVNHTLLSPDEIELKVTVSAKVFAIESIEKQVLLSVEEVEAEGDQDGGIYIYFVQPGDTLWSIAKRYNTTIGNILKYNNIENQDHLKAGSRMMIFNRLDSSIA